MNAKRSLIPIVLGLVTLSTLNLQLSTAIAQPVTNIAQGCVADHSLFLKSDGSLWVMGFNRYGQLGDGTYLTNFPGGISRPEQIVDDGVKAIAAGANHSLFLKSDGSLWVMGSDWYGQLGDDIWYQATNRPEEIVPGGVTAIAAGLDDSFFIKSDGSLWAMGFNAYGELGDGTYGDGPLNGVSQPEQIVASGVKAIAAGAYHTLFLKSDGSLWTMGRNDSGQLGDGTYFTNFPYGSNQPEQIVADGVTAIAAGFSHSLFLKSDGSLWAMGFNDSGQLGDGTCSTNFPNGINRPEQIVSNDVAAISAGASHSLFLKSDGSLWAMGFNYYGQLGNGTYSTNARGICQPEQIVSGGVIAIAAGRNHSLFLKSDGSLWGMGYNSAGQLGNGTTNNTNRPEQILGPYNQIQTTGQLSGGTNMQLSFVGIANANYALDRASSLSPANWTPQATNPTSSFGPLVFTNAVDPTTNNFWRIRSVP